MIQYKGMEKVRDLRFELNFRSGESIYEQIVEQVRSRIAAGQLRPGDQLPTVRQLALELRVNFNTVARAYRILDESGLISTQQGRGTYILEPTPAKLSTKKRRAELAALANDFIDDATRHQYSLEEIEACVCEQILRRSGSSSANQQE